MFLFGLGAKIKLQGFNIYKNSDKQLNWKLEIGNYWRGLIWEDKNKFKK